MVNFCNPGVLGTPSEFRKHYESPILQGREPQSTADEAQLGLERSAELSRVVNDFILRRTNALLSAHLPPKASCFSDRLANLQEWMRAAHIVAQVPHNFSGNHQACNLSKMSAPESKA